MDSGLLIANLSSGNSNADRVCVPGWRVTVCDLECDMSRGLTSYDAADESSVSGLDGPPKNVDDGPERRKLKNEDSSYDSDFEPCESTTNPRHEYDGHEDVSRTVSETLGAEFDDYVTHFPLCRPTNPLSQIGAKVGLSRTPSWGLGNINYAGQSPLSTQTSSTQPPSVPTTGTGLSTGLPLPIETVVASEEYPQQVEFGVKLGYPEPLVQLALAKLGLNPDKNELLDELIRLGAGAPKPDADDDAPESEQVINAPSLRQIIIDGSNVAMSHGNKVKFSCKGIRLCVDWFRDRGHAEILVFVPMWRKEQSRMDAIITDREVLQELEAEGVLAFTPSRSCGGKRIVAYDDRYIIKEALKSDGVVVSNDNYRDLLNESPSFRKVIESSLLMYSWVNGRFEPPDDPLGRNGPSLEAFLRKPNPGSMGLLSNKDSRPCPYGRKCTYGNKCKYVHPERGAAPVKSVTEILHEQKQKHYQDKAKSRDSSPGENLRAKSLSLPSSSADSGAGKKPLSRTQSNFHSLSSSQTPVIKEGYDYTKVEPQKSPVHTPISSQTSLECSSVMKGDSSLFSLPSQISYTSNSPWPNQDSSNQSSNRPCGYDSHLPDGLSVENLHPKLQRQLSLNPGGDDRLHRLSKQHMMGNPPADYGSLLGSFSMQQQQQQNQRMHQQLMSTSSSQQVHHRQHSPQSQQRRHLEVDSLPPRSCLGNRCISPGAGFPGAIGSREMMQPYYHPPLTRHSSQEMKPLRSFPQQMLPDGFHNPVGRNLSAPDHLKCGSQQHPKGAIPHITRLNSTSDSSLNMHVSNDLHFGSESYDDNSRLRMPFSSMPSANSKSPGPIGSRPLSPQTLVQTSSLGLSHGVPGTNSNEDERLKIFYHLSQLFPEAQVRSALAQNPEETDPTKICMSILSMSGCRPISPQQIATGNISLSGLSGNMPLRGAPFGSFPATSPNMDTAREAARLEAYSKLSKLFSDEQVRNVLMRYPDETDATKLCMYLMALNCQS